MTLLITNPGSASKVNDIVPGNLSPLTLFILKELIPSVPALNKDLILSWSALELPFSIVVSEPASVAAL